MRIINPIFITVATLAVTLIQKVDASVVYFEAHWSGTQNGNSAIANATIGIDTESIPNPGSHNEGIPSWFDSISITVSGASSGNGTFTKTDFQHVAWDTAGGTLDFDSELINQATTNEPWGTNYEGESGDFNLFQSSDSPLAPEGSSHFQLTPAGSEDTMNLVSFKQLYILPPDANDAELHIFQSIELIFPTKTNAIYQVQTSTNLIDWINFEAPFKGDGVTNSLHFSIRNMSEQYYRVKEGIQTTAP